MRYYSHSRAFAQSLCILYASFIFHDSALANPAQRRADSTSASITSSSAGSASAAATTLSGTVDPDLVPSTLSSAAPSATATNGASTPPDTSFPKCTTGDVQEKYEPFCRPLNGSDKYPGNSYYVTWDASQFSGNTLVNIELDYVNVTGSKGGHVISLNKIMGTLGYATFEVSQDWLQGKSRNNISLTLTDPSSEPIRGPIISITKAPLEHLPGSKSSPPNRLGLEIGIPVGIGFFVLMMFLFWFGVKNHTKLDLKGLRDRRRKGYGVGKSRRQRMGKKGPIRIDEPGFTPGGEGFRDDPENGLELQQRHTNHETEESLGSLANSPARNGFGDQHSPTRSNTFRNEISRLKSFR